MDYQFEKLRLKRALGSAQYRDCTSKREKLNCLLFTFSIKPSVLIGEKLCTKRQVYYRKKKKGEVRETAGRPPVLEEIEVEAVKDELRRRAEMKLPATRRELVNIVRI